MNDTTRLPFYSRVQQGGSVTTQNKTPLLKYDELVLGETYYVPAFGTMITMKVTSIKGTIATAENNPTLHAWLDYIEGRGWISDTAFNPKALVTLVIK